MSQESSDVTRTALSLFTGAGGLDLGFERSGFAHIEAVDNDRWSVETVRKNRPGWQPLEIDVREYAPTVDQPDVLLAGPPCQGFSLGGHRRAEDKRNTLYREVFRIAHLVRPRVVVIENVLNLRTMRTPDTGKPFADEFASGLAELGYDVSFGVFRMSHFGVPQTRRRFVFVASLDGLPVGFHLPTPGHTEEAIRSHIFALAHENVPSQLPNHDPVWGFKSRVHRETGAPFRSDDPVIPVRISRTSSDGNPIRSYDSPFPAIDTGTVWGFAQGDVKAERIRRLADEAPPSDSAYANPPLWRLSASRLRRMTHRELARLQTFPDDYEFVGDATERSIARQIGNAVPVAFAQILAQTVTKLLDICDGRTTSFENPNPELPFG